MSTGKTRTCPHCKATILESLSICPGCMHHLRFDSEAAKRQVAAAPALRVEGIIRHPPLEQPLEYFVIIAIRNDRGEEVTRQVVNVGALQAAEKRTFSLSVEVLPPQAPATSKSTSSTGTFKTPAPQPAATVKPPTQGATTSVPSSSPAARPPVTSPPGAASPSDQAKPAGGATAAQAGAAQQGRTGGSSAVAGQGTKPSGAPGASPSKPGDPAAPATSTKPTSGYILKPPSPGGPKRH